MFTYKLENKNVPPPSKNNLSDAGYDLHLITLKKIENEIYYYDTGVSIELPEGYYSQLVGRSSIAKSGYMLANNIGIIDNHYRGNIIVGLRKVSKDASELKLPCKLVQLLIMKQYDLELREVSELSTTDRQDKGGISSDQLKK